MKRSKTALPLLLSLAAAAGIDDPTELQANGPYCSVRPSDQCRPANVGHLAAQVAAGDAGAGARELPENGGWRGVEGPAVITGERLQVVPRLCSHIYRRRRFLLLVASR
jgi:hypothetical protein